MIEFLWLGVAYVSGALPFSVWLGRKLAGIDVMSSGDRNPGATNAMRLGGRWIGLLVLLLDISKAAAPVGLAYYVLGIKGPMMWLIAVAPGFGHIFSPFLGWSGGKGLAAMLGTWIGVSLVEMPAIILVQLVFWYFTIMPEGWVLLFTLMGAAVYVFLLDPSGLFYFILLVQVILVIYKHFSDYRSLPRLRKRVRK